MLAIKAVLFVLILTKYTIFVSCVCEKLFVTICESLLDVQYNTTRKSWSELLIQQNDENKPKFILTHDQLDDKLENLNWLAINNHLGEIRPGAFTYHKSLEHLILYGNNLKVIRGQTFYAFRKMQKLRMENNNIEKIEKNAFSGCNISMVDISHNKIEILVLGVFRRNSFTETLLATHNKLSRIEENSLPTSLRHLHLDYNNFQDVPDELRNLQELKELTLSHNDIGSISGLKHFRKLSKLDVSFNKIDSIRDEFDNMEELDYLNLSANRLEKLTFTPRFIRNMRSPLMFLLAHNLLRNLDLDQINVDVTFTLSGNPWNCKCIERIEKIINNNNNFTRTVCDHMMFGLGQYPYCINDIHNCSEEKVSEELLEQFQYAFNDKLCDIFNDISKPIN